MVIIHVMGGLGNQLYQYAMYEKLKYFGKQVKLDLHAYETENTDEKEWRNLELTWLKDLKYETCTKEERTTFLDNRMSLQDKVRRKLFGRKNKTIKETKSYMPEIFDMDEIYLYGYWTCEKYYEDIIPLLQEKIQFKPSECYKNVECMEQMKHENAVSIHIRRTDYLTVADGKRYMGICTDAYYQAAMQYICEHVQNPVFYIFSDDVEFARAHFKQEHMRIVDWNTGKNSLYDMQLMSCCKHNICANSTFSMWGARLNRNPNKIMLRPLHCDNYETDSVEEIQENWAKWILVNPEGKVYEGFNIGNCTGV